MRIRNVISPIRGTLSSCESLTNFDLTANLTSRLISGRIALNEKADLVKRPTFSVGFVAIASGALVVHCAKDVVAQESVKPAAPAATLVAAVQLSSGAEEVLKLSRAKLSDDVIVAFIHSSGRQFGLNADKIIYLRKAGLSDRVLTAMLTQSSRPAAAPGAQPPVAAPFPPTPSAPSGGTAQDFGSYAPPDYQTVPATDSTVYVTPEAAPYYYASYPYYGYSYPAVYYSYGGYPYYSYCRYPYSGYRGFPYYGYYRYPYSGSCGYPYYGYGYGRYPYSGYKGGYYHYRGNSYKGGYYRGTGYAVNGRPGGTYNYNRGAYRGGAGNASTSQGRGSPGIRSPGRSYRGGPGTSGVTFTSFSSAGRRGGSVGVSPRSHAGMSSPGGGFRGGGGGFAGFSGAGSRGGGGRHR